MESLAKYNMSFTTGGLLEKESETLVKAYIQTKCWKEASEIVKEGNLFQYRTFVATNRVLSELKSRFSFLNEDALNLIISGFSNEAKQIIWLAICQKYTFIFEFINEVIREKYILGQFELTNYDFDAFFNKKMLQHQSLEKITDSSRYKLKQVLFKMLRDLGMLSDKNFIQAVIPTANVVNIIRDQYPEYLSIFVN